VLGAGAAATASRRRLDYGFLVIPIPFFSPEAVSCAVIAVVIQTWLEVSVAVSKER
jgi:hypothetical protein